MTVRSISYKNDFSKAQKAREERAITLRKRIERRERKGMRMPRERAVYQVSTNTAKKNLEAAKLYLAKRKQKKDCEPK